MIPASQLAKVRNTTQVAEGGPKHIGLPRNYSFTFGHMPTQWEIVETKPAVGEKGEKGYKAAEHTWLPRLKKLPWQPGVNGVRKIGKRIITATAETLYRRRGFTLIPVDAVQMDGPHGLGSGGYLIEYPGIGGTCFLARWEVPKIRHGAPTRMRDDEQTRKCFNDFRLALVERGIIKPPDEDDIADNIEMMRARIARHAKNAHVPKYKAMIDEVQAMIDAGETAKVPDAQ